jgi:acyl dehydratase
MPPTGKAQPAIDTSDLDRYLGRTMGGGQLLEPITVTDIRRFAQGMQYPNPLHYDAATAARSRFGRIVAPQSFSVCCDIGHGAMPSVFGRIPGSHMVFGGDEWWFYGPRIFPGDKISVERRHHDYRVAETRFAGPTVFARGDSTHVNQRGERISTQRSTSVRYLAEEARKRGFFAQAAPAPRWTQKELDDLRARRLAWIRSGSRDRSPRLGEIAPGTRLPQCVIGPHSLRSFVTEWRSFIGVVWGATVDQWKDTPGLDAGWLPEMTRDFEAARDDPSLLDGLYAGSSRGHADAEAADLVGIPRAYGYGASMGAWALNYLAHWAGDEGFVRHANLQYRFPPFEGDATFLDAEVVAKGCDPELGLDLATLEVSMTNQDGSQIARGTARVELPR